MHFSNQIVAKRVKDANHNVTCGSEFFRIVAKKTHGKNQI